MTNFHFLYLSTKISNIPLQFLEEFVIIFGHKHVINQFNICLLLQIKKRN